MSTEPAAQPSVQTAESLLNATLIERFDFNPALAVFKIRPDDHEIADFKPGQFCTIGLPDLEAPAVLTPRPDGKPRKPKLLRRAYSIASSPNQKDHLDLFIVRVDEGKLTPRLWEMSVGDRIFLDPRIKGTFSMEEVPEDKILVFVSTGTGLAPYMSMIDTYRGTNRWKKAVVIHGCRYAEDLGYREKLEALCKEDDSLVYIPSVTREPEDSDYVGERGRVHKFFEPELFKKLTGEELKSEDCHVFLCGGPQMIDQAEETLQALGFTVKNRQNPEGNIHFERYW